jgi:catechol 2,3-dioxygenase-like lactoylglutathione lyase family enzyme
MTVEIVALSFAAHDPGALARFWAQVLGRELVDRGPDGPLLPADDDTGFVLAFERTQVPRRGPNQMHFDLSSATPQEQAATVERALALGASHLDVGQLPDEEHVVLADPEGNEFCVVEAGNGFLEGTGRIGCVSSDGTHRLGRFWSAALGWPLVWDHDEETAIQSPRGGSKISWGGPPLAPRSGSERLRWHVAPTKGNDPVAELARLLELGATRVEGVETGDGRLVLADPDGNKFHLLRGRATG